VLLHFLTTGILRQAKVKSSPSTEPNDMVPDAYQLFVSYAAEDRVFVERQLLPGLQSLKVKVFYDQDLPHGQPLHAIFRKLAQVDEVLVLLTKSALESLWVLAEIGGALTTGKTLIPICYGPTIEELRNCGLSELMGSPKYLDWSDEEWIKYLSELGPRAQRTPKRKARRHS
jgi:hypothetical protein